MSVSLGTVLLCVTVTIVARCDCATLKRSVSLPQEAASTTLRLTAQRNDTGSWTTQFGNYQMIIEHKHFDTTKDKYDDGIWTVKVKHTSTIYPDKTDNNRELSIEASEQLTTTISNLTYNSQTAQETTTATDNPFTAGINFNAEMLPSNDISEETEQYYEESPYDVTEEKLTEARDYDQNTMDEKDKSMKMVERRKIMERHPRSGSFVYDVTEHENYKKGYNFYSGIGWLKLNTSDWQWPEARLACEDDGGYLAIPNTMHKIHIFRHILKGNADILRRAVLKNQVFVGVYYPDGNRKLTTVLGTLFQTDRDSVWFPDEPNNAPPGEDCITLHLEGKLRDVPCFYNLPFLCQID